MKNTLVSLIQKCICIDFLINSLISSNSNQYINFLSTIKKDNLKNIKFICHLYEYTFKDFLILEDMTSIKLDSNYENNLDKLLQLNLNILSDLESLKAYKLDIYASNLLESIIYSYFNLVSSIQYFEPIKTNNNIINNKRNNIKNNSEIKNLNKIRFFNLSDSTLLDNSLENESLDFIRETSIHALSILFNYSFDNGKIIDEGYEVFFENNPDTKFYQYFFKTEDRFFKIRVLDKTKKILYIYQNTLDDIKISKHLNKDDAKKLVDSYLQDQFGNDFKNLLYDKDYLNTFIYENLVESYKFKYNYKDTFGKIDINNAFYITISSISLVIQEIYLF